MKSKTKRNISICCITEKSKGFGNISRCITLADGLHKKGYNVNFIITKNKSAIMELQKRKFEYSTVSSIVPLDKYYKKILKIVIGRKCDTIILDMREYGERISKRFMGTNFKIILLDDAWGKNAYANMIINGTPIKQYHKYKKINKNSKLLLDTNYWIMKKEFRDHKKDISDIRNKKTYQVVISVGGSDPYGITQKILESMLEIENIKIIAIVGSFFNNLKSLHRLTKNKRNISIIYSSNRIWEEFHKGDLVISGAGNTLFELAAQQIPTICVSTVKHQIPYAKFFASKGFTIDLGFHNKLDPTVLKKTIVETLDDKQKRKEMARRGYKIIDGNGLDRVISVLEKFLNK